MMERIKQFVSDVSQRVKTLLYSKRDRRHGLVGQIDLWKMKRNFQIDFLRSRGLRPKDRLLDLGCGTLRGGIPMIDFLERGNYSGLEVREDVLREAWRELEEAGLEYKRPHLIHMHRFPETDLGMRFDYIFAFSVLIHMDDNTLRQCMEFVRRHLEDKGRFFANVNTGARSEGRWEEFPLVFRPEGFYRQMARTHALRLRDLGSLESLGHRSGDELSDRQRMLEFRIHD